jgi:hypothetical protein
MTHSLTLSLSHSLSLSLSPPSFSHIIYSHPFPHPPCSSSTYEAALLKALSPFEKAYISRSQTRLIDVVNQLFGVGSRTLPKEEEILSAVKTISRSEFTTEL